MNDKHQVQNGDHSEISADDLLESLKKSMESLTEEGSDSDAQAHGIGEISESAPEMKIEDVMKRYLPSEDAVAPKPSEKASVTLPADDIPYDDSDFDAILGTTANIPAIKADMEFAEDADDDAFEEAFAAFDRDLEETEASIPRMMRSEKKKGGFFASLLGVFSKKEAQIPVLVDEVPEELPELLPEDLSSEELYQVSDDEEVAFAATPDQTDEGDAVAGEIGTPGEDFDETDAKLMLAFGMEDELAETMGYDRASELGESMEHASDELQSKKKSFLKEEEPLEEYTDLSQTKELFARYRRSYYSVLLRLAACVVLLLFSFFLENLEAFGGSVVDALSVTVFPSVHVLVNLQLLVLACALIHRSLLRGLRDLLSGKPGPESVTVAVVVLTLLYHLFTFIWSSTAMHMYNFPVILCVGMNLFFEYMNTKREIYALNVISSKRPKYVAQHVDAESAELETEGFRDYLPENPIIFRVSKTKFADSFCRRSSEPSQYRSVVSLFLPAAMIACILFFVLGWIFSRSFTTGLTAAYLATLFVMPFSVFLCWAFPLYKASKEAYGVKSALIGENAITEYSGASAISFEDQEVFPAYGVKVKSVKVYGENRIDTVLYQLSGVFSGIGGPLCEVLRNTTRDLRQSEDVQIHEIRENGLHATVDGISLLVGKAAYLYDLGIPPVVDADDAAVEQDPEISIMYMVADGEVAAKIYVQYVMDPDFEFVVKQMYKIGVCVGIKTFDPNIDDEMISANIRTGKYPVRILKCKSTEQAQTVSEHTESGVVSKNGAKALLQTLSLCDRVVNAIKTNIVVKIFSMVLALILMGVLLAFGVIGNVPSMYVVLYQIFWMVPSVLISRILIGRL